ncbi:uncharacterized protein MAM_03026 [Metarhizium album ARSEF 1941]|uniref:Allergen Asp f 4 n=1 Tax=Metarhizium album (strain ARSEF 1941) TaxID=1081103 RepID=A0A0B2WZ81_METAS|nr:uncharacterized protein MAM_03026 [Metarhizium album ARSEF 1941]KHN99328.1 hypothetical protein MAM_03026 [Metarhizium album ARSEF 1941]
MKFSSTTVAVAAALGVAAHPGGLAHKNLHRQVEKRTDFFMNTRPLAEPPVPNPPPPPPPPATTSVAKPTPTNPSGSAGKKKPEFCSGPSKRASAASIAYKGNVGTSGNYGCNMMAVDDTDGFNHTLALYNNSDEDMKCTLWNKIGPTGGINGFFKGNQALEVDLPARGKKNVAFQPDTQGGAACGKGEVPYNNIGLTTGLWVEYDYGSAPNGDWNGADASGLTAADSGQKPGTSLIVYRVDNGTVPDVVDVNDIIGRGYPYSLINADGSGTNAYTKGTNDLDGVGIKGPGTFHIRAVYS